ncbi:inositol-3-phosphate synthase [Candidatus Bathyarchaeota archaeon]|nr:inositol-3-phosphate synthase [Candidatus Bathyarchaeota archaeon]
MSKIKIAIAGLGNCASALIQGMEYYRSISGEEAYFHGLMNPEIGGFKPSDIEVVAAFDINTKKIGNDVSKAIFAPPNVCEFIADVPEMGVTVKPGPILDGCAPHMRDSFYCYDDSEMEPVDVAKELMDKGAEMLINFLPVGSALASRAYASAALEARCGFINCIPEFIASDDDWARKFEEKSLPIAGDDIKSQVGATILHRVLGKLFLDRGVIVDKTYQLNIGGNTDFENMKMEDRLKTKRISKTSAVSSVFPYKVQTRIGPSDYVPFLKDKKICYIRIDGVTFGGLPLVMDAKLRVEDSPNSAGVVLDIIRCMKIALDRNIAGRLDSISSFSFKHPPVQPESDVIAKQHVAEFIKGDRER